MSRTNHRKVLECASPLALLDGSAGTKSGRGLPQSKALTRARNVCLALSLMLTPAHAATNAAEEIGLPKLAPPLPELPPTFWEQHGFVLLVVAIVALVIAVIVAILALRPKRAAIVPPEVEARRSLEELRSRAEDGAVLSRVSQILRR